MSEATDAVATARAELAAALNAIDDRLNPAKAVSELGDRIKDSVGRHPVAWAVGGGVALVVIAGAVAWAFLADD